VTIHRRARSKQTHLHTDRACTSIRSDCPALALNTLRHSQTAAPFIGHSTDAFFHLSRASPACSAAINSSYAPCSAPTSTCPQTICCRTPLEKNRVRTSVSYVAPKPVPELHLEPGTRKVEKMASMARVAFRLPNDKFCATQRLFRLLSCSCPSSVAPRS
jgi:hypothetical protein